MTIRSLCVAAVAACLSSLPANGQRSTGVRLIPELVIPSDPVRFVDVADVSIGKDGAFYVRQAAAANVVVFSNRGTYLRTIGRRGVDRGEFQAGGTLGWLGDTLWSTDFTNRRTEYFDTNGRSLGTRVVSVPLASPSYPQLVGASLADGSVLATPNAPAPLVEAGRVVEVPLLRVRRNAQPGRADTVALVSVRHLYGSTAKRRRVGVGVFEFLEPLNDGPLWAASRDGTAYALVDRATQVAGPHEIRVRKFSASGSLVYDVRIPYEPLAITPAFLDSVTPAIPRARGIIEPRDLYVPAFRPPVSAVMLARDGRVWLRREAGSNTMTEWLVLGANGVVESTARVDSPIRLFEADAVYAWGAPMRTSNEASVARYRIRVDSGKSDGRPGLSTAFPIR